MSDGCFRLGGYEHDLLDSMELPISICDPDESRAGWPFRKPKDEPEPLEDTSDWPDDHKLDDPRHVPYSNLRRR